jgi:ABC-type uncharacterized transport system substrate-binding protein
VNLRLALMRILFGMVLLATSLLSQPTYSKNSKIILFIRFSNSSYQNMFSAMSTGLTNYTIIDWVLEENTTYEDFAAKLTSTHPDFMVLMGDTPVRYGQKFDNTSQVKIPGLALMALNLPNVLKGDKNIAGISFESPCSTVVTLFRNIVQTPIKKVLAFYRKSTFSEVIELAKYNLKLEKIELEAVDVETYGTNKEALEKFLKTEVSKYVDHFKKYDAVWIMLDSVVLGKEFFVNNWVPAARNSKIPFLTNIESLVNPQLNFSAFAVVPNMRDLAGQAAETIRRILEKSESPEKIGVEQPISFNKILNKKRINDLGIKLHMENLGDIKILGEYLYDLKVLGE